VVAAIDSTVEPICSTTLPSAMPEQVEDAILSDNVSLPGELECPICYQMYCDPIRAGCDRHAFCRNCLLRSQRGGDMIRCPICRCESRIDASSLPVAADVLEKVEAKDPCYSERLVLARREREDYLKSLAERAAQMAPIRALAILQSSHNFDSWSTLRGVPLREVQDAGSSEVNGIYVAGILPTYVGPPLYRKLNTSLFIYRWRQTRWVIAELHSSRSMGDEREWLYHAPAQSPEEVPPIRGWEVSSRSQASRPPPEVRLYEYSSPRLSLSESTVSPDQIQPTRSHMSQLRARCGVASKPKCCIIM